MPSKTLLLTFAVANLGILWQWFLKDIVFVTYGVSRVIEPLSSFPYTCRRITDHNLAACEDAWLDESSRQLFMACSNSLGRKAWTPCTGHLAAERRSQHDHVVAMNIDTPHPQDSAGFDYRLLDLGDYENSLGDPSISMVGMTGSRRPDGSLSLYFVNAQPTFNVTPSLLADQTTTGANFTIESFTLTDPTTSSTLKHQHTFYNPDLLTTPNRPAARPDGTLYISNDHGPHRVGLHHALSPVIRTGTIVHCAPPTRPGAHAECTTVGGSHAFPNGLHYSARHSELYVPSSITGKITVYRPNDGSGSVSNSTLTRVTDIATSYPLDNISEDNDGDLWVAGFPKLNEFMDLYKPSTPIDGRGAPSVAMRVRRKGAAKTEEWDVEKIIEDASSEALPGTTTVVRDAKTGRLFFVGVISPWIAVCEPK